MRVKVLGRRLEYQVSCSISFPCFDQSEVSIQTLLHDVLSSSKEMSSLGRRKFLVAASSEDEASALELSANTSGSEECWDSSSTTSNLFDKSTLRNEFNFDGSIVVQFFKFRDLSNDEGELQLANLVVLNELDNSFPSFTAVVGDAGKVFDFLECECVYQVERNAA